MTVWETALIFGGAPIVALAVLAALTFAPGASRSPRYRVGKSWDFEPVWYVARPDIAAPAGSAEGRAALAAASRPELPAGASAASAVDLESATARGGASGEW